MWVETSSIHFRFANCYLLFRVGQYLFTKIRFFRLACNPKHCLGIVFLDLVRILQSCRLEEHLQVPAFFRRPKASFGYTYASCLCSHSHYLKGSLTKTHFRSSKQAPAFKRGESDSFLQFIWNAKGITYFICTFTHS